MYYKSNCHNHCHNKINTYNINTRFIAPNPPCSFNPNSVYPTIDSTEGSPFYIGSDTNIQDGVILHGLANSSVRNNNKKYSIYIGKHVSCAHGCIIHGPCKIGNNVFVGFNAIVFNAIIGDDCYISTNALVTDGVIVDPNRFIPYGAIIDTQEKADRLISVSKEKSEFAQEVLHVNAEFPCAYSLMFGSIKCKCGIACNSKTIYNVLE